MAKIYSVYFILLTIRPILGISSNFLWSVTNATLLEKKVPKYCPKVIFYNNATLANVTIGLDYEGIVENSFINIEETLEENFSVWDEVESNLRWAANETIYNKWEPCIVVISLVFNSTQYEESFPKIRDELRHRLSDLFQYSTPVRTRHLVLMRVSEEFSFCTKGPKYPSRLVPQWEMVLFDFFNEARVIQGLFHDDDEPYLKVTKELGKWKWFCEDIIERLEVEQICKKNETCLAENPGIGEWRPRFKPNPNCTLGFRPRQ